MRVAAWIGAFAADTVFYDGVGLGLRGPIGLLANGGFEVSYVPDDGAEHRVPLAQAWAVPLEQAFRFAGSSPGRDSGI